MIAKRNDFARLISFVSVTSLSFIVRVDFLPELFIRVLDGFDVPIIPPTLKTSSAFIIA